MILLFEHLPRALPAALAPAFGDKPPDVRAGPDGLISWVDPSGQEVVAEVLTRPTRPTLTEAWKRLRAHANTLDAIPVVVVPHLTRSLREIAARDGINWVDLAGNATVQHPSLRVRIEGRKPSHRRVGPGVDPFSLRNADIARQLLVDPKRTWRQKDLVARTGISQPQASKVLRALQEMALVARDDDGSLRVDDASALLDAWADAYRYSRQRIVPAHLSGEGIELARDLHRRLRRAGHDHWFTGLPAAWAYDRFARFRLVSVFVAAEPEVIRQDLGLREAPRGANVHLIAAGGQRVDLGAAQPDRLPCAHPAQVYVDLLGLPERAHEAAEHLRPLALGGAS
jgi:DNA-binding transcriptional ArsR family regulator